MLPLFVICQNLVSPLDLLKLLLVPAPIGMVLESQALVGLANVVDGCGSVYTQDCVEVSSCGSGHSLSVVELDSLDS
jgi:hypothetical protein